jgi:hypothetical protein
MITSRYFLAITAVFLCLALLSCGFIVYAAGNTDSSRVPEYQKWLFGDDIISVDIQVDRDEWQSMLNNATAKEWLYGDLIINGERFTAPRAIPASPRAWGGGWTL